MSAYNPYFVSTKRSYPQQRLKLNLDYFAGIFLTTFIVIIQCMGSETMGLDRFQHMGASIILFLVFCLGLKGCRGRYLLSFLLALSVGFGKEFLDHQGDIVDVYFNGVGVAIGALILLSTSFIYTRKGH